MTRQTFTITLRAEKGVEPWRALRALLKYAGRVLGLRRTKISHEKEKHP